jgi:hypothetical protein
VVILFFAALQVSVISGAYAGLKMKPGQWRMEMKIFKDGKEDVSTQESMGKMGAALKNMTPEQKAQMQKMTQELLKKMGKTDLADKMKKDSPLEKVSFDSQGIKVCYTKEMIESGTAFQQGQEKKGCKISNLKQSPTQVSMDFKCNNGASGSGEWKSLSSDKITGKVIMEQKDHPKLEVHYTGSFLSERCSS